MSALARTARVALEILLGLCIVATLGLVLALVLEEPQRPPCPCVEGVVECEGCARVRAKLARRESPSAYDWCRSCDDADFAAVHGGRVLEDER